MKKLITLLTVFCLCFTVAVQAAALKYGNKGTEVSNLQKNLNQLGYNLEVDGSFGPATKNAVLDFQRKYGLEVDGIAGPATQGKINELLRDYLKRGDKGPKVAELQNKLNKFGYGLDVDGSFGKNTENAVRDFQSRYSLKVDGIAGKETQNALDTIEPPRTDEGLDGKGTDDESSSGDNNTNLVNSNLSKVSLLNQEVKSWCKATSVAQALNIISGYDKFTRHDLWVGGCANISGNTYRGSDGNNYRATYKQDKYVGSYEELKTQIDEAISSGLPIVVPVHGGKSITHHWVTIVGKNGNDYTIIEPSKDWEHNRLTTMNSVWRGRGYDFGLTSYEDGITRYGYISFKKQ